MSPHSSYTPGVKADLAKALDGYLIVADAANPVVSVVLPDGMDGATIQNPTRYIMRVVYTLDGAVTALGNRAQIIVPNSSGAVSFQDLDVEDDKDAIIEAQVSFIDPQSLTPGATAVDATTLPAATPLPSETLYGTINFVES